MKSITKFYNSLFLQKYKKTWCLLKKCIAMNHKTHRVNNFSLQFLLLGFIFFFSNSIFRLLLWQISSKANSLVILEVAFETCIFSVPLSFLEREVFVLFKLIYFWIAWPNSYMERDEGGIFSKVPDWKPLFLLKIKLNKTQASK